MTIPGDEEVGSNTRIHESRFLLESRNNCTRIEDDRALHSLPKNSPNKWEEAENRAENQSNLSFMSSSSLTEVKGEFLLNKKYFAKKIMSETPGKTDNDPEIASK